IRTRDQRTSTPHARRSAPRACERACREQTRRRAARPLSRHPQNLASTSADRYRLKARRNDRYRCREPSPPTREHGTAHSARSPQSREHIFREGTRPATNEMIRFIDEHRDRFGVEFLCRTLRAAVRGFLTSRGYRAAKKRLPSPRQLRDEILVPE